jgi:hypothetical protein
MAAHMGGLAGGFLGGLVLAHPLTPEGAAKRWVRTAALAAGTAVVVALGATALPPRVDFLAELERFSAIETRSLDAYNGGIRAAKAEKLDDAGFADLIDAEVLPEWHAGRERLAAIQGLPAKQAEHLGKVVAYATVREEAFRLFAEGARKHDQAIVKQANDKQAEADRLVKQLGEKK